ncbi:MAG TPA: ABC transporter ATP-binding protein [Clostridiaceae bacterium]
MPVFFNITIALLVIVSKSLVVTGFFLVTLPISLLLVTFFRKNIRTVNTDFRKKIEEMSSNVAEMVEMVPVTRAHGLENLEIKRIDKQLNRVKNSGYKLDIISALFGSSSWATFQIFQVMCLAFTGSLAYNGKITIGDVVLYQSYFTSILTQVSNLINNYPNIVRGIESINSVGEIILVNDIEDNKGKLKIKNVDGEFIFNHVGFSYRNSDEKVLDDFNLKVKKGECIAFVGGKLSGGQRQRIAIARALIRDPQVIILDEATSALDNISELAVQNAMENLIKNRTTFIVAHRLSTIRNADKIVVMKDGKSIENGTYQELVDLKGEFYNLKKLQI